jgi:hypothetical protein
MKTRAFLIATVVSAILQSLYYIVMMGIMLLIMPGMMESFQDIPSSGGPPPGFFNLMGITMLTSGISLVLAPIVYAGTGALYAWLHRREDQPVSAEQGAIGGAAAAFTARFATGLLITLGSVLLSTVMYQMMGDVSNSVPNPGSMPFPAPIGSVIGGISSVIGGLFSACFGSVIAAALGALGGSLTGALLK